MPHKKLSEPLASPGKKSHKELYSSVVASSSFIDAGEGDENVRESVVETPDYRPKICPGLTIGTNHLPSIRQSFEHRRPATGSPNSAITAVRIEEQRPFGAAMEAAEPHLFGASGMLRMDSDVRSSASLEALLREEN